jgi:hypothetical protein
MSPHVPHSDAELFELEALALDAAPGPWQAQVLLDYTRGETIRAVVRPGEEEDEVVPVVDAGRELEEDDQRYIAAVHPDAVLRLVREVRRLRRMEERYETVAQVLEHLDAFLERRGLVAQAQRFVEVRAQLERIHPADRPVPPGRGATRRAASTVV